MHISGKMKKDILIEIEIPEEVEVLLSEDSIKVKGKEGEAERKIKPNKKIELKKEDKKIVISSKKATKKEKRLCNTLKKHIINLIKGVQEKFEYELKVCSSHFPMSVSVEGNELLIKNFFGEKEPRKVKIPSEIEVSIGGDIIRLKGVDKEKVGQTAAEIEKATYIKRRDRRIFQDGVYIISKAGRKII